MIITVFFCWFNLLLVHHGNECVVSLNLSDGVYHSVAALWAQTTSKILLGVAFKDSPPSDNWLLAAKWHLINKLWYWNIWQNKTQTQMRINEMENELLLAGGSRRMCQTHYMNTMPVCLKPFSRHLFLFPSTFFYFQPYHKSLNNHSQTSSPQEEAWSAMKTAYFLIHSFLCVIEVRAARHKPTSDAELASLCVSLIGRAAQRLVISPLMSCCQWRKVIPHESTACCQGCQGPELFHLHSNTDAWVNRQQAPNLLPGLRGQDETKKMARSWNQRANSSGHVWFAKKFPLEWWEVL